MNHLSVEMQKTDSRLWPKPIAREVGLFTDLALYAETLQIVQERGAVTAVTLRSEIGQRLQKMRLVKSQSPRTIERLLRELRLFNWLELKRENKSSLDSLPHLITKEGIEALAWSKEDPRRFRRLLAVKMHRVYTVPGWFVARLWEINPEGQGDVILPAPLDDWRPPSRGWSDAEWDRVLHEQILAAARCARDAIPTAFPVTDEDWVRAVKKTWVRLSSLHPRGRRPEEEPRRRTYSPRARLRLAMREAAVGLLFDNTPYGSRCGDYPGNRPPIYPRTFMGWCPRLETLELIFYTDWHPAIPGRLLFPTAAFRDYASLDRFELLRDIRHPHGEYLWLHQPQWDDFRVLFLDALIDAHQRLSRRVGSLYVSLLDVRDETCRQLRLSALHFDDFLEHVLDEMPSSDFPWSISVETDIRAEQSSGYGLLRRPVYLDGVPHSLIALARLLG